MDPCHGARSRAPLSFIITPYLPTEGGTLRPMVPDRCCRSEADGPPCHLLVHHWRDRKTGPEFPLLVLQCRTHGIAFTLYPPGHVPYGRCAVAPVDLEGQPLFGVDEEPCEATLAWEQTLFGAAQDAARRQAWPRRNDGAPQQGCWRTQGRRIAQLGQVLGLAGAGDSVMVGPLGISALGQREAEAAYGQAKGYEARGRAVSTIASELQSVPCDLLDLILAAGFVAGSWGRAYRWDTRTRQLRPVVPRARSP